jgi:septum formation protein
MSSDPQKANLNPLHNLLLASASPRRKELLAELIPNFRVVSSDAEELTTHPEGVVKLVQENARIKAEAVSSTHSSSWVLGADTVVALGEKVFGKPKSMPEAEEMLLELSGQSHQVHTGLCLINRQSNYLECRKDTSTVHFRKFNREVISHYYHEVNPLDKAGGYAIQTNADLIVEKFEGSYSNVVGLPLELLKSWFVALNFFKEVPDFEG